MCFGFLVACYLNICMDTVYLKQAGIKDFWLSVFFQPHRSPPRHTSCWFKSTRLQGLHPLTGVTNTLSFFWPCGVGDRVGGSMLCYKNLSEFVSKQMGPGQYQNQAPSQLRLQFASDVSVFARALLGML